MCGEKGSFFLAALVCLLVSVSAIQPALAQSGWDGARIPAAARVHPESRTGLASTIRLDVRLVLIPVTVTDPFGQPRSGLPQAAFRLFEDGTEQRLRYFATEDAPISLGVVFDSSGSMQHKLERSREAAAQLFKASMPGDEFFLVEFNDAPRVLCDFTTHPEEIEGRLTNLHAKGLTALFDAVYLAVHRMRRAKNPRKALVILSDGGDNNSRYTESEIRELVREADVSLYSIGMLGAGTSNHSIKVLRNLAEETGGRLFTVGKLSELPEAVSRMNAALRDQYVLGYSSSNTQADGKYRKVEVKLEQPPNAAPLRASWRVGYYAPAGL
jgi:Ca-activated chloride channel family protein